MKKLVGTLLVCAGVGLAVGAVVMKVKEVDDAVAAEFENDFDVDELGVGEKIVAGIGILVPAAAREKILGGLSKFNDTMQVLW